MGLFGKREKEDKPKQIRPESTPNETTYIGKNLTIKGRVSCPFLKPSNIARQISHEIVFVK